MNAILPETPSESAPGNCGPACCYAETMPGTFGEWVWCKRAGANVRMVREGRACPWFTANAGAANAGAAAEPASGNG
jgi:hypothetical protein